MDDLRQFVTDAAVKELRTQLSDDSVDAHGTSVQVDGSFRMVRLVEAIVRASVDEHPEIVEEVARTIATGEYGANWEEHKDEAVLIICAVRSRILSMLDPLP